MGEWGWGRYVNKTLGRQAQGSAKPASPLSLEGADQGVGVISVEQGPSHGASYLALQQASGRKRKPGAKGGGKWPLTFCCTVSRLRLYHLDRYFQKKPLVRRKPSP